MQQYSKPSRSPLRHTAEKNSEFVLIVFLGLPNREALFFIFAYSSDYPYGKFTYRSSVKSYSDTAFAAERSLSMQLRRGSLFAGYWGRGGDSIKSL